MMKLTHKTPCNECPWRKNAPAGWLGGNTPEDYADMVARNTIPPCHLKDHGQDNPKSSFCVGALHVARNSCTMPHATPGAIEAADKVGKNPGCFQWVRDFYRYHAGKEYVPLIERLFMQMKPKKKGKK